MVWCIANDLNFELAKKIQINERFPFLEFSGVIATARVPLRDPQLQKQMPEWIVNSVSFCDKLTRPRFIKSHLSYNLLPRQIRTGQRKPKIVYVARNPKDICISFYHHSKLLEGYCGTFDDFCRQFLGDKVAYAPYWEHVGGFWKRQNQDNILFIKYEDMKKDLPSVIKRTATFLNKTLSDPQVFALAEHLSFASMKNNPALNRKMTVDTIKKNKLFGDFKIEGEFIRSGQVGQWKEAMDDKMKKKFDEWIETNTKNCEGLFV